MNSKTIVVLLILLFAITNTTLAATWELVTEDESGTKWYVDTDSVFLDSNGVLSYWDKGEYGTSKKGVSEGKSLVEAKIKQKRLIFRLVKVILYDKQGKFLYETKSPGDWDIATPDSIREAMINFAYSKVETQ